MVSYHIINSPVCGLSIAKWVGSLVLHALPMVVYTGDGIEGNSNLAKVLICAQIRTSMV